MTVNVVDAAAGSPCRRWDLSRCEKGDQIGQSSRALRCEKDWSHTSVVHLMKRRLSSFLTVFISGLAALQIEEEASLLV